MLLISLENRQVLLPNNGGFPPSFAAHTSTLLSFCSLLCSPSSYSIFLHYHQRSPSSLIIIIIQWQTIRRPKFAAQSSSNCGHLFKNVRRKWKPPTTTKATRHVTFINSVPIGVLKRVRANPMEVRSDQNVVWEKSLRVRSDLKFFNFGRSYPKNWVRSNYSSGSIEPELFYLLCFVQFMSVDLVLMGVSYCFRWCIVREMVRSPWQQWMVDV